MKETEALVRLQEIDLELMRYRRTLGSMPQARKVEAARLARKKLAGQISQIVGQRKDCEMEIEDNEAHHARLEQTVGEVQGSYEERARDYRGVQDLETQLTALAKGLEKLEFRHGELEGRLEKLRRAESNARGLDARLVEEEESQAASLREETAGIRQRVESLVQERDHCLRNISDDVRRRYEAAFKHFGGLAVETLRGNVPSVCRVQLQPAAFGDVKRGPAITECPYCHRMLVTEGMFDADAK